MSTGQSARGCVGLCGWETKMTRTKNLTFTPSYHLSQERIHTSCIKHSVRIQNGEIALLNELLTYRTHCLLMPYCPGLNNLLRKSIFHCFCSVISYLVRFWLYSIYILLLWVCCCVFFSPLSCKCVSVCFSSPIARFENSKRRNCFTKWIVNVWNSLPQKSKSKRNIAVSDSPHRYGNSHAIWDHTVLPATR